MDLVMRGSREENWSKKLSDKTVDDYLVRRRSNVSWFSILSALSGLLGVGLLLFIIGLVVAFCILY